MAKKRKKPHADPGPIRRASGTRLRAERKAASAPPPVLVSLPAPVTAAESQGEVELEIGVPSEREIDEVLVAYAEEQRASERVAVAVEINLASDSQFFSGLAGDISEGGLFVSTYRALPIGSAVDLEFSLPGSDAPLHARGVVRWLREHSTGQPRGVGIAFDALSEEDRERIHRFCEMRPPLYYEDLD